MTKEEFYSRALSFDGVGEQVDIFKKEKIKYEQEIDRLNNIINELEEYIKPYLYMLNGITDRDVYEQCQLDDFTMIMEKLQQLKGSDKSEK